MSESKAIPLWQITATAAPQTSALCDTSTSEIVVIGAGFCGLSTSLHLSQLGARVICLEANSIGWGASGRNNGQVIAGLKLDPMDVIKKIGAVAGEKLIHLSDKAPDLVFQLIKKHNIKCDATRNGWIQPARSPSAIQHIESRLRQWQSYGVSAEMIDGHKLNSRLGTNWYKAAWFDPRGGSINPLAFARGLASAAIKQGARIYTDSPVISFQKNTDGWIVITANGSIQTQGIVMCTNAYNNSLDKKLTQSVVPVRTAQMASTILTKQQHSAILPAGEAASDVSRLLTSFRLTADKRLIMGGAFATGGKESPALFTHLRQAALNRFPFLDTLNFEYAWSGYLAITKSHLPHIFQLDDGYIAGIGCNGRGIAMTTSMGKYLATIAFDHLQGRHSSEDIPFPKTKATPFAFHQLREIGIAANVAWSHWLDRINK